MTGAQRIESPAAAGLTTFAGVVLVVVGLWDVLQAVAALVRDTIYVGTPNYVYAFDLTAWGWLHLLLGIVVVAVGVAVLIGWPFASVIGIVLVGVGLLVNFMFLPWYPVWSLLTMALYAAVLWALAASLLNR